MSYLKLRKGMRLYFEDVGKGPAVIMMHGWTSNSGVFSDSVKSYLQYKARCITYDHRGHGKSKDANVEPVTMEILAQDLDRLINALSLSDVTLVGWSMGAGVAMNYIKKYGCSALKQVVLCDMTPKQLNDDEWKLGLNQGNYTQKDMEEYASKDFLSQYKAFSIKAKPASAKLPNFILNHILRKKLMICNEDVLKDLASSMKSQDNRDFTEKLDVPLTYFYAEPGSLFSPELADWYKEHVNVPYKAVPFPNSTHLLISENSDKFAREIAKLL
ncbi:MAG: alpha/beta hydrolase [Clostridia bacterium]|nr:alpha/beta hydrolase [Clostridia bacterium]